MDNKKRKVCVTTGTRSEYGLLKPILKEIVDSKKLELFLIVSGMHLSKKFGMTINEIKNDGFKVNSVVDMVPKGDSNYYMSKSLGNGILEFSKIFNKLKPNINLILGDRDEAFASALAASHMNIVNAHIHGGDKSKAGIDEYNRHAITKISNLHFAASKKSKERIIRMGENPKFVYFTGSPGIDDILKNHITDKKSLEKKYQIKLNGNEIILLQHPVTTQSEDTNKEILSTLKAIVKLKKTTIAIAPNSDAGHKTIFKNIESFSRDYSFIKMYKNLPRSDFLGLLKNCGILVGNSSSGIIEASYFKIPVLNIGIRQDQREHGKNVINVNFNLEEIHRAILKSFKSKQSNTKSTMIYGRGNTSKKIISILEKIKIDKELIQKQISY